MGIATYLTLSRLIVSPLFYVFYVYSDYFGFSLKTTSYLILSILLFCETTDALDGYLARRLQQVTPLGKILDPMSDSISRITIFLAFTSPPISLPLPLIMIFIYRDSIMSTLRTVCALNGFALAASKTGKIKAILQAFTIFSMTVLFLSYSHSLISLKELQNTSFYLTALVAFYTIYSLFEYLFKNQGAVQNLLKIQKSDGTR